MQYHKKKQLFFTKIVPFENYLERNYFDKTFYLRVSFRALCL